MKKAEANGEKELRRKELKNFEGNWHRSTHFVDVNILKRDFRKLSDRVVLRLFTLKVEGPHMFAYKY